MDDITLLQECVVKVEEIKEEDCLTFDKKCVMQGKNSDEVNTPVAVLLQPKVEMKEAEEQEVKTEYGMSDSPVLEQNDSEEEELKPLASVYIKTEVEMDEGTEEQEDHLMIYPVAGCKEWDMGAGSSEEEADAGVSSERSEHAALEEMKNDTEESNGSGSNRAESPAEEREASKPEKADVPTYTNKLFLACVHCSGSIRYDKTLEQHKREHPEEPKLLTCDTCQRQFTARIAPVRHTRAQIPDAEKKTKFPCEICGKEFKFRVNLNLHVRAHTGEIPYIWDNSEKTFTPEPDLSEHRGQHAGEKSYECEECGETFEQSSEYTVHLRIHTGEKPYNCSVCSETFSMMGDLNNHMFTHSHQEQMLECEVCGINHTTRSMNCHMRIHTPEKPYKCRFCETAFAHIPCRRKHEETHSDNKLQCKVCGKKVLTKQNLQIHMRRHTGERPYKCAYCEKTFIQSSACKSHEMTHTKNFRYNCAKCGKGYLYKFLLVQHLQSHGN